MNALKAAASIYANVLKTFVALYKIEELNKTGFLMNE